MCWCSVKFLLSCDYKRESLLKLATFVCQANFYCLLKVVTFISMNSSGGFNHGMGSDQANNHHGTYNNQSLQNDGQNNSIESSTQQQQQSTQHNFGMMDNNNMDMNHDQVSIALFVIDIWNI